MVSDIANWDIKIAMQESSKRYRAIVVLAAVAMRQPYRLLFCRISLRLCGKPLIDNKLGNALERLNNLEALDTPVHR